MSLRARVLDRLEAGRPELAWDCAVAAFHDGSPRERHAAARLLRWMATHLPDAAWTGARLRDARQVEAGVPSPRARVGEVGFPVVRGERARFVVARVRTVDGPDRLPGEAQEAVRLALDAVRSLLQRAQGFEVSFDHHDWDGASCGLAVALAALSAARGIPVSDRLVATGALDAQGRVLPVGELPKKAALRSEARPRARLLVPPDPSLFHPTLVPVHSLAKAAEQLAPDLVEDVEERLQEIRQADRRGDWVEAARLAGLLVDAPDLTDDERAELLVILLAAANHGADGAERARWDRRLREMEASGGDELVLARAIGTRAIGAIDAFEPEEAREILALAEGRTWGDEARLHLDGPAALGATLTGDHGLALSLRQANLERATPDERARCGADLADALLRVGRPEEAITVVERALEDARVRRRRAYQQRTEAYLRLHLARAQAALRLVQEARRTLDAIGPVTGIDPAVRVALLRAELDRDPAAVTRAWSALPPWAQQNGLLLALRWRTLARLGDPEAARSLRALPVFAGLTVEEAALRLPY